MDSHGESCPCFYCSDFGRAVLAETQNPESVCHMDLENSIHPIFGRNNFHGVCHDDYDKYLEELLRLASRFLDAPSLARHVVNMAEGELYYIALNARRARRGRKVKLRQSFYQVDAENHAQPARLAVYPKKLSEPLSPSQLGEKSRNFWLEMAPMVSFAFEAQPLDTQGHCEYVVGCLPERSGAHVSSGCMSRISLSSKGFAALKEAVDSKHPYMRQWQLSLARLLLHELGHSTNFALFGCRDGEVFPGNARLHEAGFAFESALFGGCVSLETDDFERPELIDWPSSLHERLYNRNGDLFGVRWEELQPYDVVRHLPSDAIARLFMEGFWKSHMETRPMAPLITGYPMARWIVKQHRPEALDPTTPISDIAVGDGYVEGTEADLPPWTTRVLLRFGRLRTRRASQDLTVDALDLWPVRPWEEAAEPPTSFLMRITTSHVWDRIRVILLLALVPAVIAITLEMLASYCM